MSRNDGGSGAGVNTSPDGSGAAGTGAAGTGAAGTSPPTCGGDLVGAWWGSDPHARPKATPPADDPCYELLVERQDDGTLSANTRWPAPERRDAYLKFDGEQFAWAITDRGPVTIAYAASCLAKATPKPTCGELAEALLSSGLGEGSVRKVDCVAASGGCTCTFEIISTGGPAGSWSSSGGILSLTAFAGTEWEKKVQTPYCATATSLRFAPAIDAFVPGLSRMTFEPASCDDGKQGLLKEGIDCGPYCSEPCP
jgi:hypothetical protein